tara:strand:+ start:6078 stop:6338 length:261 start_codon:yes stop_codon:yes gene_type:complete
MFFWSFPQPVSAEKLITIKGINIEMSLSQVIDVLKNKGFTSDPPCVAAGSAKDEHCLFWNNDPHNSKRFYPYRYIQLAVILFANKF